MAETKRKTSKKKPGKKPKKQPLWKTCSTRKQHGILRRQRRPCPECGFPGPKAPPLPGPGSKGRNREWEDKRAARVFLEWLEKGAKPAAAARQAGWSPKAFSSWKRWVEFGVDSGGRKVPAPDSLIAFMEECEAAGDKFYLEALESAGELVRKRDRIVTMRVLARADSSWREGVGVELSGSVEGLGLSDVHTAARLARSVQQKESEKERGDDDGDSEDEE